MSEDTTEGGITTPLGSINYKGKQMAEFIAVLCLCLLFLMSYVIWEHKIDTQAAQREIKIEVTKSLDKVAQSQEELSYLISLTPEQRSNLNLAMPDSLRRRLRER